MHNMNYNFTAQPYDNGILLTFIEGFKVSELSLLRDKLEYFVEEDCVYLILSQKSITIEIRDYFDGSSLCYVERQEKVQELHGWVSGFFTGLRCNT